MEGEAVGDTSTMGVRRWMCLEESRIAGKAAWHEVEKSLEVTCGGAEWGAVARATNQRKLGLHLRRQPCVPTSIACSLPDEGSGIEREISYRFKSTAAIQKV